MTRLLQHQSLSRPWRWRARLPVLATVALCVLGAAACVGNDQDADVEESPDRPHLLLLTVDTLRADHMSLYGYERNTTPALERFAETAITFDRAIAQWPKTGVSFASMFIGRYPQSTGLTHRASLAIPPALGILPETLREEGYRTIAVISNPVLSAELGWDRGFDEFVPAWGEEMADDPREFRNQIAARRITQLAIEALERHGYSGSSDPDQPLFLWAHYSDPHGPYLTPEGFENPYLGDPLFEDTEPIPTNLNNVPGRSIPGLSTFREYIAQYDANVLIVDQQLDRLLTHLNDAGLVDDALTIVTADHGESLDEHGLYFEHGPLPYNTTAHVPLVVRPPVGADFDAGSRVGDPVELIDLAPTIVEVLLPHRSSWTGLPEGEPASAPPPEATAEDQAPVSFDQTFEGRSLRAYWNDPRRVVDKPGAFSEAGSPGSRRWRSLQTARYKLNYKKPGLPRRPEPRDFELFDLTIDPLETNNLLAEYPDIVRQLRTPLLEWTELARPSLTESRRAKSEAERRALRNLGYLQ